MKNLKKIVKSGKKFLLPLVLVSTAIYAYAGPVAVIGYYYSDQCQGSKMTMPSLDYAKAAGAISYHFIHETPASCKPVNPPAAYYEYDAWADLNQYGQTNPPPTSWVCESDFYQAIADKLGLSSYSPSDYDSLTSEQRSVVNEAYAGLAAFNISLQSC